MRVGKDDGHRERAEDDVAKLNATRGDDITETKVVFAKELREVMEENEEKSERPAI